uniref:Disks large homolog 5-like n=1 Tax=Sinocyclocheilus grahami TaxID=75366 RepID=A0A672R981_SINGR
CFLSSAGSTYSILSTMPSDSESSSSLSSVGTKASSPPPALGDTRPASENLDTILFQLRQVTRERDELRKRLALASPGTTFDDCRPNSKPGHDYERLKTQCMKAMADLQSLQNQHTKTLKRCEEAVKEHIVLQLNSCCNINVHNALKEQFLCYVEEFTQLPFSIQVIRENGSSEVLNKLYDTAMDKLEGVKKEYDVLSQRYSEKVASHNTDLSRLEQVEEENRRLQKQTDALLKQRDTAIQYQQQWSTSMRRFDSVQQEMNKASAQNKELQREMERLQSEVTRYKNFQLKAVKDAEKYKEERDSVFNEYRLIMSERDQVIKEVDKLQTELEAAEARLKNTSSERMVASEEVEALRQELNSSLVDRDRAICERNELLEKYCHEVKDKAEAQKELSQACKDIETVREERDVARKERTEAIIQRDQLLREYYQARQVLTKQDSATLDMERANKEIDVLRKQCEAMSQELKEAVQEAEVAKCRRDWAFQERDKIVAERESIRTLCDNLRRERDRAVSDLADALRNLDDMRKQRNDAARELKELKEKMESQLEKEARFCQLMAHSSHDSAIDTDSLEWETEVVEFEKDRDDMDLKAMGFDIAEGVNDPYLPGDCGIFVTRVDKGSIVDGRLRVNDWLLKINDVDLTNKDRKQVIKAVLNGGGLINMVVRRRKSLGGRLVTPVHINLIGHKDAGITLEGGVYVAAIAPGSPAAREGSLTIGDRLIAINGIALDNKSLSECEALLRGGRDSLALSLMKVIFFPQSTSGQNIFESLREAEKSNGRIHLSDIHSRNSRNLKHNSSTQTDIYSGDTGSERRKTRTDMEESGYSERKVFPISTLHPNSLRPASELGLARYSGSAFQEVCYTRSESVGPECLTLETSLEKQHSGGTWPKMVVGVAMTTDSPAQLSIYRSPKQRKPIDADTYKRPDALSKTDYHLPQALKADSAPTPPTPPTRSDSFKFKHKHQGNSASESTVSAMSVQEPKQEDRNGNLYFTEAGREGKVLSSRKSCEEDIGRMRPEEPEVKRPRPKSAPALRRRMTPQTIPLQSFQVNLSQPAILPVLISLAQREMLRSSPNRPHRHSVGFVPTAYNGTLPPNSAHRGLAPCSAITAVMKNPVYMVRSHRVHTNNCPTAANQINQQHTHPRYHISLESMLIVVSVCCSSGSLSHSECSSPSLITPPLSPFNLETSSFASSQSQSSISTLPRISVSPVPTGERRKDRYTRAASGPPPPPPPRNSSHLSTYSSEALYLTPIIGLVPCVSLSFTICFSPLFFAPLNLSDLCLFPASYAQGMPDKRSCLLQVVGCRNSCFSVFSKKVPEPRLVTVRKTQGELGIQLCGGNLQGIFVERLEEDSPARGVDGLVPGDMILEVNGATNKTVEEAYLEMLKPAETVTFRVQHRLDEFNQVKDTPGDGFYIRALYDRVAETELDLSFKKDDILYVDDTLPNGNFGTWMAWQLDENAQKIQRGQIPSKYMMDQEFYRRHSMTELKDEAGSSKTLSAAARRSFFRRKQKHKRSSSKDGKDAVALDAISTDSIPFLDDFVSLAYQRVQKIDCMSPRPVLILGPLVDPVKDMLVKESPEKFSRCVLEVMKASQQAIERGVKDFLFIDYKRRSGHFDVTTVASIKEITDKDCHCLLDIAPHAIERLHSVHIYPIVIFIRYKNAKQIKEQKDPVYLRDKVSQKHSKEQFETAQKIEQEYSKFFTGIVQGGTLPYICTQIVTIVDQEQSKVLWTPLGSL